MENSVYFAVHCASFLVEPRALACVVKLNTPQGLPPVEHLDLTGIPVLSDNEDDGSNEDDDDEAECTYTASSVWGLRAKARPGTKT